MSDDITPSDTQHRAIAAIRSWFEHGTEQQQVFRLFGFAGTGKSTVLKFALGEIGLEPHRAGSDGEPCAPGVVTARHERWNGNGSCRLGAFPAPARTARPQRPRSLSI